MTRIPEHRNWIGGTWREGAAEITFEVCDASGESLARFPRSSVADLDLALEAGLRGVNVWRAMTIDERTRRVDRLRSVIESDSDRRIWIERRLGLSESEYAQCEERQRTLRTAERVAPRSSRMQASTQPGVVFLAPDWSELLEAPLARMYASLIAASPVVLRADRELAGAWDAVAQAIERADLPTGSVSLLHEDTQVCLSAALVDARIARVAISGPGGRLKWATERASASASETSVPLDQVLLCNRSQRIVDGVDLEAEARKVVDEAFGRAPALSGQAPGQVGRVLCPERSFSRFTAALLAILDNDPALADPVAILDPATKVHLVRAHQLGIDEGATLILARRGDALEPRVAREGDEAAPATASRAARADGILRPVVFTNVEEHMRIAWLGRPAPVLCLMRVENDEHASALAVELDGDSSAEDLSA